MTSAQTRFTLHEDWTVVLLGSLIIILALVGLLLPVPVFGWKDSAELFSKVLSPQNLLIFLEQFVFVLIIAALGASFTGKKLRSALTGFPVVYLLTIFALILAGNTTIKGLNLEAVIISLSLGLLISNTLDLPEW